MQLDDVNFGEDDDDDDDEDSHNDSSSQSIQTSRTKTL